MVALSATVDDDGQPIPVPVVSWSGPPGVVFGDPGSATTSATLPGEGSFLLQVTADDTELQTSDTLTVTVEAAPALASIAVSPDSISLLLGEVQVFTASGSDQYGDPFPVSPH